MKFRWETEFKETDIGEIPRDWGVRTLSEIAYVESGNPAPQPERYFINGKYPFVRVKHLNNDKYIKDFDLITDEAIKDKKLKLFRKGVLIFPRSGESIKLGKYNIVPFDSFIVNHLAVLYSKEDRSYTDFIFYLLTAFDKFREEDISGTTLPYIKTTDIGLRKIPYPPPSEQSRIANVLSWFDDLIENKKRQNEILEKTAMAIFKNWFIDFEPFKDSEFVYNEELGREIPKGWEVKKIGEIAKIIMGQSPPSKYYNEESIGYPFIQGKGQFGKYNPNTTIFCSFSGKKSKPKDVLITVRAPVGELNIADDEYIIGRGVAILRTDYWVYHFLYLKTHYELLKSYERGTTYDAITKEELEKFPVLAVPPSILQSFHSLVEPLFQKIILNQKQIMLLRKIRDRLLPLLVFGKLRVEEL